MIENQFLTQKEVSTRWKSFHSLKLTIWFTIGLSKQKTQRWPINPSVLRFLELFVRLKCKTLHGKPYTQTKVVNEYCPPIILSVCFSANYGFACCVCVCVCVSHGETEANNSIFFEKTEGLWPSCHTGSPTHSTQTCHWSTSPSHSQTPGSCGLAWQKSATNYFAAATGGKCQISLRIYQNGVVRRHVRRGYFLRGVWMSHQRERKKNGLVFWMPSRSARSTWQLSVGLMSPAGKDVLGVSRAVDLRGPARALAAWVRCDLKRTWFRALRLGRWDDGCG